MAQEQHRGVVGPVQVVEDEQQGRGGRGLDQQRGDRIEQAESLALGVAGNGLRGARQAALELGHDAPQLAARSRDLAGQLLNRRKLNVVTQCLHERLVRRQRLGVATPIQHDRAVRLRTASQLGGQPRLAHARLAAHEHHLALTRARPREVLTQRGQFLAAASQPLTVGTHQRGRQRNRTGARGRPRRHRMPRPAWRRP